MFKTIAACFLVFVITLAVKDVGHMSECTPHIHDAWLPVQIGFIFGLTMLLGWLAGKDD